MKSTLLFCLGLAFCHWGTAQNSTLLINNVQIFNGKDEKIVTGNVLIVNNLISKILKMATSTKKVYY
jgi:hypothetical protein